MTRRAMLVAVALSCLVGGGAAAGFWTGNELLDECQDDPSSPKSLVCRGYIMGFVDALDWGHSFCSDPGVTAKQFEDVVKFYLRNHPETRHLPAADLVTSALKEKFPCGE